MIDKKLIILIVILLLITTAYFFEDEITSFINGEGSVGGNNSFNPIILNQATMEQTIDINNPMSLTDDGSDWDGKTGVFTTPDGRKFPIFNTLKNGIRAGVYNMIKIIQGNGKTITQLFNIYAPPSGNDTTAYINNVGSNSGIDVNANLDLTYDTIYALAKAIISQEQGAKASEVLPEDIDAGVNAAMKARNLNA